MSFKTELVTKRDMSKDLTMRAYRGYLEEYYQRMAKATIEHLVYMMLYMLLKLYLKN